MIFPASFHAKKFLLVMRDDNIGKGDEGEDAVVDVEIAVVDTMCTHRQPPPVHSQRNLPLIFSNMGEEH